MVANVERMALIGEPSWHRLENVMHAGASLAEWRRVGGLMHEVIKAPVRFITPDDVVHQMKDKFVLYRSDTNAPLSVVSNEYNVVQPKTVIDFFANLIDKHGFTMETCGSLGGGRKVWALARTNRAYQVGGNDILMEYVLFATSYDGTFATVAKHTSVRVVCQNTLFACLNAREPAVRITHRNVVDIEEVQMDLGLIDEEWINFTSVAEQLHKQPIEVTQAMRWYAELLTEKDDLTTEDVQQLATDNRAMQGLIACYSQGRGAEATLWGWLNGATAFIDHVRGRSADSSVNSAWFGAGATLKAKAWVQAQGLLEKLAA
jgi:phage/plasmid-like protein (TIGR03299 family)